MPVFGPGYEVSFEFYLHSRDQVDTLGYGWLIGVKGGGVAFYEIDGRMAIWFGYNRGAITATLWINGAIPMEMAFPKQLS